MVSGEGKIMSKIFSEQTKTEQKEIRFGKYCFVITKQKEFGFDQNGVYQDRIAYELSTKEKGTKICGFSADLFKGDSTELHIKKGEANIGKIKPDRYFMSILLGECYDDLKELYPHAKIIVDTDYRFPEEKNKLTWFQRVCLKFDNDYVLNSLIYCTHGEEQSPINVDSRRVDVMRGRLEYLLSERLVSGEQERE